MDVGTGPPRKGGEVPGEMNGDVCNVAIPLHSAGLWSLDSKLDILSYSLPRLQLQLVTIFLLTQSLHVLLFKRVKFQRIVAEITAGIILGPTIMGKIPGFSQALFPAEGDVLLDVLSKIGYIFFMFLIGVKMDPSTVIKTGKKAWIIGVVSVITPVITSSFISFLLDRKLSIYRRTASRAVLGIQTLTPFAVVAHLLIDLRLTNSELGRLALSAALISDLMSTSYTTLLTIVRSIVAAGWANDHAWVQSPILILSFVGIIFGMRPLFLLMVKQTPEGKPVKGVYVVIISCIVLLSAIGGDTIGLQYQLGPFLLGLVVPHGPPLGSTLVDRLETLILGLLAPLMVSNCGLQFDLYEVFDIDFLRVIWVVFFFSTTVKILSVLVPALLSKMPLQDAAALSAIMSSQGIVELASFMNYYMTQTIDRETFGTGTLSVLIMDMTTSRLVTSLYGYSRIYTGYKKRDMEHMAYNAELRVLACTHRQDDALAVIKLLEVTNPTKEIPLVVYSLHMVELIGQTTPLLINHELGQKTSHGGSRSKDVIDTFRAYEQQTQGAVNVQAYTAMSLSKFMQDDICYLAFDKLVSFIILPFHRKWNQQGKVVLDNNIIRTINRHVLDTAPCSVGILVDRRKMRNLPSDSAVSPVYRVAVIFLEGNDDREALSYARRMTQSPGVHLSVIRLVSPDNANEASWETIIDTDLINDTKRQLGNQVYKEEIVNDGSDTALIVRQLAEAFDLIITGRRHRDDSQLLSGLSEWTELPELGPLGDILASADIDKPVSVLVVQQQLAQI